MAQIESEKRVWGGWGVGKVNDITPCHLEEVMSEQLAKQLQEKENKCNVGSVHEAFLLFEEQSLEANKNFKEDLKNIISSKGDEEEEGEEDEEDGEVDDERKEESDNLNGINYVGKDDSIMNESEKTEYTITKSDINMPLDMMDGKMREDKRMNETSNDYMIAQMMQHDMILQHNRELRKEQDFKNGNSKVKLSNEKMFYYDKEDADEEDEEEEEEDDDVHSISKGIVGGGVGKGGGGKVIITKHNAIVAGRRNASRMEKNLHAGVATGDSSDLALSNTVYNALKVASKMESKRAQRMHEKKEQATKTVAMDDTTKVTLMKLVGSGVVLGVGGVVSGGKEAAVFHARGGSSPNVLVPEECAVKVFKKYSPFKTKGEYMRGDIRFRKGHACRLIKEWVEKEDQNLRRMTKFGIPCPQPITKKNNILVMSFIGRNQSPAPKLTDALLTQEEFNVAHIQSIKILTDMYQKCHLVHSDFSQYNLLWWEGVVYVIDVAQAVLSSHPKAFEYLMRDCINITQFFQSLAPISWQALFNNITGLNVTGDVAEFSAELQSVSKEREAMKGKEISDEQFEYLLHKTNLECRDKENYDEKDSDEDEEEEKDSDEDEEDEIVGEGDIDDDFELCNDEVGGEMRCIEVSKSEGSKGDDEDDGFVVVGDVEQEYVFLSQEVADKK